MLLFGHVDENELMKNDLVRAVVQKEYMLDLINESTAALDAVTVMLLIIACSLAFVVLFNLTVININERKREIATIKVLGFLDIETAIYINREIFLITLLGIGLGLVAGIGLTTFVLKSVEIDMIIFPHVLRADKFILSAAISIVFAVFVWIVTYNRLVKIDMVESLKDVE
jgi:putative ABC transport system permease protein